MLGLQHSNSKPKFYPTNIGASILKVNGGFRCYRLYFSSFHNIFSVRSFPEILFLSIQASAVGFSRADGLGFRSPVP